MLTGIMMVAMLFASYGVVYLMYGKDGMALRQRQGKKILPPCVGIALMLIIWGLCVLLLVAGKAAGDTELAIGVAIIVPVIIIALIVFTRIRIKQALEAERQNPSEEV